VTLTNPNGSQVITITSSFGNYSFTGLAPGQSYTLGVSSKRYRFTPQVMTISNNLANVDFIGLE